MTIEFLYFTEPLYQHVNQEARINAEQRVVVVLLIITKKALNRMSVVIHGCSTSTLISPAFYFRGLAPSWPGLQILPGPRQQMQESMGSLQKENEELKNLKAIDDELELKENAYWRPSAPETRQGPFCIQCWSQYEILQPLVVSDTGHQTCPNPDCDGDFPTTESRRIQKERNARALAHAEAKRAQLRGRRSNRPIDPF